MQAIKATDENAKPAMHLALICPDMTGHLNPMTTLGRALIRDGHRVTLLGMPGSRAKVESSGLEFLEIGVQEHASGEMESDRALLGRMQGFAAVRLTGRMLRKTAAIVLRDVPSLSRSAGIEGFVVDQVSPAGNSVAESLGLPFAVVCNALAINMEAAVPPAVMSWPNYQGLIARCRNRFGNRLLTFAAKPVFDEVNTFRVRHRLSPLRPANQVHGELIQVAQQPAFFDFPRNQLPEHFHYTGPWHEPQRDCEIDFPWDRLDGRPLLYASLGTLQNRLQALFQCIVEACSEEDVQLVLSLGRHDANVNLNSTSNAIIVPYAPQLEILKRASAVITHAGLNTVMESLSLGLPMVAIPMTNDQPGVASRLKFLGVAEVIQPSSVTAAKLRQKLKLVLQDPKYRNAAQLCMKKLQDAPKAAEAAALIGHALATRTRIKA